MVPNAARWSPPAGRTWRRGADPSRWRLVDGRIARGYRREKQPFVIIDVYDLFFNNMRLGQQADHDIVDTVSV
jgi:hypothetical protein